MRTFLNLLGLALLATACTTVASISTSQIPQASARHQKVSGSASNLVLLFIPFGNSFVDRAREEMESKCPKGSIEGVLTKHQDTDYFLRLVLIQEAVMEGYCLAPGKKG
jgi:FtsH-binding integral membrane protein